VLGAVAPIDTPIYGVLCFTIAGLPWLRTGRMRGRLLMYGRALAKRLQSDGTLSPTTVDSLTRALAAAFAAGVTGMLSQLACGAAGGQTRPTAPRARSEAYVPGAIAGSRAPSRAPPALRSEVA
jgi:hypothetical protein